MFRVLAVVALAAVALADDQADFAAMRSKIQSALAAFDPAFVQKIQELGKNLDLSKNQKIAQIKEAVAALPADQQEKAQKFMDFGLQKEQEMVTLAKSLIPDFSAETQAVLNKIVSTYENGADVPTKDLVKTIKEDFTNAPESVKTELKAAKNGLVEKVKEFAKSMVPAN